MSLLLAALVVVTFAVTIQRLGLANRARRVLTRAAECADVLRDPCLDDRAKERILQGHAVRLFGLFAGLALGGGVALLLPLAGVWALDLVGVASFVDVLSVLERVDFLAATAVVGLLTYLLVRRFASR